MADQISLSNAKWTKTKSDGRYDVYCTLLKEQLGGRLDYEGTATRLQDATTIIKQCVNKYPDKDQILQVNDKMLNRWCQVLYINGKFTHTDPELLENRIFNYETY